MGAHAGNHRQKWAMMMILSATILASGSSAKGVSPSPTSSIRRFLAVANETPSLITIVASPSALEHVGQPLTAGTRVRILGTTRGQTFRASRIDILD